MSKQHYCEFESITIEGVEYVSPAACSFGDYGGCGSYGLSNIQHVVKAAGDSVFETYHQSVSRASESVAPSSYAMDDEIELRDAIKAKRKPLVLHASGGYSSETVWIKRHTLLAHETLSSLANYSSLDDDGCSAIETEWENEAWENCIEGDLNRKCWPDEDLPGYADMSNDDKFSAYRFAMEVDNCYPEAEYSSVFVDVDRIAATYAATIVRMLAGETIDAINRAQWPTLYSTAETNVESV